MPILRPYRQLISIGKHCRAAHQLRRITGRQSASYFDWIGTPHQAILYALRNGLESIFRREYLGVTSDGRGVIDLRSGITYYHHFPRSSVGGKVDMQCIDSGYLLQKKKFDFLRARWYESIASAETLFIRQDCLSTDQAFELYSALVSHANHEDIGLLVITPPGHTLRVDHPRIHVAPGDPEAKSGEYWKGDDECWNSIVAQYWQAPGIARFAEESARLNEEVNRSNAG
jgi:hypothetical protein